MDDMWLDRVCQSKSAQVTFSVPVQLLTLVDHWLNDLVDVVVDMLRQQLRHDGLRVLTIVVHHLVLEF